MWWSPQAWPTKIYGLDHKPQVARMSHHHHHWQWHCLLLAVPLLLPDPLLPLVLLLMMMMAGLLWASTAALKCPSKTAQGFDTHSSANLQTSTPSGQQQNDAQPPLQLLQLPPCCPAPGCLKTLRPGGCPGDRNRDLSLTAQGAQLKILQRCSHQLGGSGKNPHPLLHCHQLLQCWCPLLQ
jgi:hypothetical protein